MYRKQSGTTSQSSFEAFTRIDDDLETTIVHRVFDRQETWEITVAAHRPSNDPDFNNGEGKFSSSEEEFREAERRLRNWLDEQLLLSGLG